MFDRIKQALTTTFCLCLVCALIAGAFMAGAASQTHITVVIERTAFADPMGTALSEAAKATSPIPQRKPKR